MFKLTKAALEQCGLAGQYLVAFMDKEVDDDLVAQCLESPHDLEEVIPVFGHRMRFIKAFNGKPQFDPFMIIKTLYNQEMDKVLASRDTFLPNVELLQYHKDISKQAIKIVANYHPNRSLTSLEQQQFENLSQTMYKKYEEKNKMRRPVAKYAIGIDLGTTNSCGAVYKHGRVEVIPNKNGHRTTPSCVLFLRDGSILVGDAVKTLSHRNPKNTVFDIKRIIGRNFDDPNVEKSMESWPFNVVNCEGTPKVQLPVNDPSGDLSHDQEDSNSPCSSTDSSSRRKRSRYSDTTKYREFHPEQISALVLKEMKENAEVFLQAKVEACVITVPALFNDSQRQATKDAAAIAGLKVLKILNEPTSAAIAYKLHRQDDLERNVLVFDLGAGTFDVAVLKIVGGDIKVKAVHGDNYLGGSNFDQTMVNYCVQRFRKKYNVDLTRGCGDDDEKERTGAKIRLERIREECERQKKVLSTHNHTYVYVDGIDSDHPKFILDVPFTRERFNSLNEYYFDKCIEIVMEVLVAAEMDKSEIDDVVLVGGSTRIPKIQEMLSEFFDGKELTKNINLDEAVAIGAAIQACILNEEGEKSPNSPSLSISDVNPLSIGLEDGRTGEMSVWIKKNTTIPCEKTYSWFPVSNFQSSIIFTIYEGESKIARDNCLLGEFELDGIPPNEAYKEEVKVTVSISDEGILSISAMCLSNGVSTDLTITAYKNRLTAGDIETALQENAKHFSFCV